MFFIKREDGLAMPLVIVVISVLTLLGISLLSYAVSENKQVAMSEDKMKAHYLARSGAHAVASFISANPEYAINLINSKESDPVEVNDHALGTEGSFVVEVYGNLADVVYVKSTGTYRNNNQTVILSIKNVGIEDPLYGNKLDKTGGGAGSIKGGNVLYVTSADAEFENMLEEGYDLINLPRVFPEILLPCEDDELPFYGDCPVNQPPSFSNNVITESGYYPSLTSDQANTLKIDASDVNNNDLDILVKADSINLQNRNLVIDLGSQRNDNTVAIVVDTFNCGNNNIEIDGEGHLLIYVKDFDTNGNFQLDTSADSYEDIVVNVMVLDGGSFKLGSGSVGFEGAIYAPRATVEMQAATLFGWIVAGDFNGQGSFEIEYLPIRLGPISLELDYYSIDRWRYDNN